MRRNAADAEVPRTHRDPSYWNPDGGPLRVLLTLPQLLTLTGRLSTRENESWTRKHTLCPQLFQEGSLPH